jgi:flagellar basal-body rod protein FlgB
MNQIPTDVFALAEKRLEWTGQRQAVLAQNIANANTPAYAARDVKPFKDVLAAQAGPGAGAGTRATGAGVLASQSVVDRTSGDRSINGNAVVLDDQLEKVAETDNANQLAMNLYKKYQSMFRTVIGRS